MTDRIQIKRFENYHNSLLNRSFDDLNFITFVDVQALVANEETIPEQMQGDIFMQKALPLSLYEGDLCIGLCNLYDINWEDRNLKLSIILDQSYDNKNREKSLKSFIQDLDKMVNQTFFLRKFDCYYRGDNPLVEAVLNDGFIDQNHKIVCDIRYFTKVIGQ